MRLGIDFGTTRTVVAAVCDGRYPLACFNTAEGFVDALPGLAALGSSSGSTVYGSDVATEGSGGTADEGLLLRSVKATVSALLPDQPVHCAQGPTALELTTGYLRYLRHMLLQHSNLDIDPQEPLEAMVAVPAHASTQQRYLTLEAFSRAGFTVIGLISEPTAAAIEYAHNSQAALSSRSPKRYVVVYDLGGGTFDAAAVSLRERRFELIGAEGIARLGGNDFDQLIADQVLAQQSLHADELSAAQWSHLLERCRLAKESLSPASRRLLVDVTGILPCEAAVLDTAPLYAAAEPLIARSVQRLEALFTQLQAHGIDPQNSRELGALYLVGGSVQFPPVQRWLRQQFARKVQLAPQPHAATAIGLAVAADTQAGIFVREAPTRHFGVWREAQAGREKVFDPIIHKDTGTTQAALQSVERRYQPAHRVGELRFVECTQLDDAGQPDGEVTPWGRILFPYDPALQQPSEASALEQHNGERNEGPQVQQVREHYEYSAEGMVKVTIENLSAGYSRQYVLGAGTSTDGNTARLTASDHQ